MNPRHELRDGIVVVKPPEPQQSYRMTMRHRDGDAELVATGPDVDTLIELSKQPGAREYGLVRLEPVA